MKNNQNQPLNGEQVTLSLKNQTPWFQRLVSSLFENKVTLLFIVLVIGAIIVSGAPLNFVVQQVFARIGRNSFTVLALLIPVLAGLGLNFSIVIGAIAAQISLFLIVYWDIKGIVGMLVCFAVTTPLAAFFGFLVGRLFNKMKGAEMIAGLILGYFSDGLYQLLFLFIFGGVIPIHSEHLMIPGGIGVKNSIDLTETVKYSLDSVPLKDMLLFIAGILLLYSIIRFVQGRKNGKSVAAPVFALILAILAVAATRIESWKEALNIDKLPLMTALLIWCGVTVVFGIFKLIRDNRKRDAEFSRQTEIVKIIVAIAIALIALYVPFMNKLIRGVKLPVLPFLMIYGLTVFNKYFLSTRIGHNMNTVGQSQMVANASGLNVDNLRVIAMVISTVLAGWGQLIYLQNLGTFATYGAHLQVGQFAIAALLVGGASVSKATNRQAITGVILFHALFIVAPEAGKVLFNNAMIGEYFRVFVSYGVIAVALAMHAWKRKKPKEDEPAAESAASKA